MPFENSHENATFNFVQRLEQQIALEYQDDPKAMEMDDDEWCRFLKKEVARRKKIDRDRRVQGLVQSQNRGI